MGRVNWESSLVRMTRSVLGEQLASLSRNGLASMTSRMLMVMVISVA
jgi:hypothetical protein